MKSCGVLIASACLILLSSHVIISSADDKCNVTDLPDEKSKKACPGGYTVSCRGMNLTYIPVLPKDPNKTRKFCFLDLSDNKITSLNNSALVGLSELKWINLSRNQIYDIKKLAFKSLSNLVYLNLTSNNLTADSFADGVFRPLQKLQFISLKHNLIQSYEGFDRQLAFLGNLESIYLDLFQGSKFGPGFKNLTRLKTVSFSGINTKEGRTCNISNITENTFQNLEHIEKLYLSSCLTRNISRKALAKLKHLTNLDISYNNIEFDGMNDALCGIENSSTLRTLNVNAIQSAYGIGKALKAKHVACLSTLKNLTHLHMDLNKIEVFDKSIMHDQLLPRTLQELTLAANRIVYDDYIVDIFRVNGLRKLDISRQYLNYDPFYGTHFNSERVGQSLSGEDCSICTNSSRRMTDSIICIPNNVKIIIALKSYFHFTLPKLRICGGSKIRRLDLSMNLIDEWNGPLLGLESLAFLDLSYNNCEQIDVDTFFASFPNLRWLNISNNYIRDVLSNTHLDDKEKSKMFLNQSKLWTLVMSYNRIQHLPPQLFQPLRSLSTLDLSNNMIDHFRVELGHCRNLSVINLSDNKLEVIERSQRLSLEQIARRSRSNLTIHLSANPLQCDCTTRDFLQWMYSKRKQTHKGNIIIDFSPESQCHLKGGLRMTIKTANDLAQIIEKLNVECQDMTWKMIVFIAVAGVSASVLTTVCCVLLYKHRWKLRYVYYSRRFKRHVHDGYDRIFEHDAVVLYAKEDAAFIKNTLVPAAEGSHGLKLWVYDRNSCPGVSIQENIAFGMAKSKKAVFLISSKYLQDDWSDYEINMAHMEGIETKRQMMVMVMMETINPNKLPVHVLRFIKSEKNLEFPEHPQDLETFWRSLADVVTTT